MAGLPLPVPNEETRPFWEYCKAGELRVQRCLICAKLRHPPRPGCPECGSLEFEWQRLSGRGRVYTYAVSHQAVHPALEGLIPHTTIVVELEEGVLMTSNLVDRADEVEIGRPVEVAFEPVSEEISLPKFRLV
ncbi:MAG TPA: OB-fold domain-containing protein [Dehalococcoidia bacterium]|nr:OB-fold domain-containing protein [Dehalococcoidia bacterium]